MDLTILIELLLSLGVVAITVYALPTLVNKFGAVKVKSAYEIIKILVKAAEQIIQVEGSGKVKKKWVMDRLESYDLQIDESKVSDLIESAVKEMNENINRTLNNDSSI